MKVTSLFSPKRVIVGIGALFLSLGVAGAVDAATTTKTSTGVVCTIVGTAGSDVLTGTAAANVICGLGGNDTISGLGGNDIIDGGVGNDVINGGDGNDTILGGLGDDKLRGDAGNDAINGNVGNDTENGGDGTDALLGSDGTDVLSGDAGNDTENGGLGNDTITGGLGDDTLIGDLGNDTENGGDGADVIQGGDGNDNLQGGVGNDSFYGDGGDDTLFGGDGTDTLRGGDGTDTLTGDAGNDIEAGGLGSDTLNGGVGDDTLSGEGGDDKVYGGDGTDTLRGGDGTDSLAGDGGNDTETGGLGNDTVTGGLGNDTLSGEGGNDKVSGGDGTDTVSGDSGNDTVAGDSGNDTIAGGDGNDSLAGGAGNDRLSGDAGNDSMKGEAGNDGLIGGSGIDTLAGANGAPAKNERNLCERDLNDTVTYCGFDENAPYIVSADLASTSVDSSVKSQTVVVTLHITDELMGLEYAGCSLIFEGARSFTGYDRAVRTSGDAIDGIYTCNVTVPWGASTGRWGVNFDTRDRAGNLGLANQFTGYKNHSNLPEIMAQSPEHWIEQTGAGDSQSPRITNPAISASTVDTSASSQTIVVEARITDDFTGVKRVQCAPRHGIAIDFNQGYGGAEATLKSGNDKDGIWTCTMRLPKGAGHGKWGVALFAWDGQGTYYSVQSDMSDDHKWNVDDTALSYQAPPVSFDNAVNYFTQTGAGDDTLPEMISVSLDKETINTSSSDQVVNATVTLAPEQYGKPRFIMFDVFSPSTMAEHQAQCTLTKTNDDGSTVWNCRFTIGLGSPKGLHPMMIWLADDAGNRNEYRVDTETSTWFTNYEDQDGKITSITGLHLGPIGVTNTDK